MKSFVSKGIAVGIALCALAVSAFGQEANEFEPVELPDNIAAKVEGLEQEKIDFILFKGAFGLHECPLQNVPIQQVAVSCQGYRLDSPCSDEPAGPRA